MGDKSGTGTREEHKRYFSSNLMSVPPKRGFQIQCSRMLEELFISELKTAKFSTFFLELTVNWISKVMECKLNAIRKEYSFIQGAITLG
jgi:hypothetical protein